MLRLFKNKLFILMLITVTLLIVMGVTAKPGSKLSYIGNVISVPLSPLQQSFTYIGKKVEATVTFFSDTKTMKQENIDLRKKIDDLENIKRELERYKVENKLLREAVNLKDQFNSYDQIGGNIIAKDAGNWFNIFTIDRGSKEGVSIYSPVITSGGLVGYIIEVAPFSSKVLSIIDADSTVSAVVSKSMKLVKVRGDLNLKDRGLCRMDNIPLELDIQVGDTVETSGVGGIFPKGILIGKVKEVSKTDNEMNRYALIEPTVDFKKLQEVFVLKSRDKNIGIGSAEK